VHRASSIKVAEGAKVLILGLTFKENVGDIRNTKVVDIVSELADCADCTDFLGLAGRAISRFVLRAVAGAVITLVEKADWCGFSFFDLPAAGSSRAGMMDFSGRFELLQMTPDTIMSNAQDYSHF
jgi:hypothetical protein